MKKFSMAVATATVMMISHGSYADLKVVYSGDSSVKPVCESIVHDQVNKLKRTLRAAKSHPLDKSHEFFTCNDMALDRFADAMDSVKAAEYLDKKFNRIEIVTTEDVAYK